ncbi:metallophosphoesterase family protein [Thioalkalivibrio sp. HK1]|uniref:metallophosphoesterase family protein n=1 Tax=Thioalkalivibrio sp. HK1 TaxID=1469245 RepID=UPI00046F5F5D|nr:DNA repair exonuclease [Thioalkalivibrio sp. HK1]
MSITLIHTADWQIGKPFSNVPGDAGAALRGQRIDTVKAIAELAQARDVDAVLVAGDVFDDNAISDESLRRTVNAMAPYKGPWVLLPGNHDSGLRQSVWSRLTKMGVAPENVILAVEPEPIELCQGRLVVLPAPLQRRHEVRDITEWFDAHPTEGGAFRVGLAHGSVTNRLPEEATNNNPISDTRAESAHLDYLALGDWHGTLEVAKRTWYAGTPEQDRFKANDPGNILLVTLEDVGGEPDVEKIPIGRYRWERVDFEVMDEQSLEVLDRQLSELGESERILMRLRLEGALGLATRQHLDDLIERWRARLHFLGVDDAKVVAQPSPDDIAELGATGFIKKAIDDLASIGRDEAHPDHESAGRALQILYLEQKGLQSGSVSSKR